MLWSDLVGFVCEGYRGRGKREMGDTLASWLSAVEEQLAGRDHGWRDTI